MPSPTPPAESLLDKGAVFGVGALLIGLFLFLARTLAGSWAPLGREVLVACQILLIYFGPLVAAAFFAERRGVAVKRWWFLAMLPVLGALTGWVVWHIDREPAGPIRSVFLGVWYGLLHALYLNWSWRRQRRRVAA